MAPCGDRSVRRAGARHTRINEEMQVLDKDCQPIEGFYAIGDCSGSYFANNYPEYLIGAALGRTLTQGRHVVRRIAGDL